MGLFMLKGIWVGTVAWETNPVIRVLALSLNSREGRELEVEVPHKSPNLKGSETF